MQVIVNKPSTVYIRFLHEVPKKFELSNENGELYYMRYLDGKTPRIKFNIIDNGEYTGNYAFEVVKISDIEIPENLPSLPTPERDRIKPYKFVNNFSLVNTPARIFTGTGVIELSRQFYEYPKPIQEFIKLHEIGHFYYKTEEFCDLFALVNYLKSGGNRSMAFYSLSHVLKKTPNNLDRLKFLLHNIQKTQNNPL